MKNLILLFLFCVSAVSSQNYNSPKEWMKYIDGNKLICELFIPGTHDSGAKDVQATNETIVQAAKTQDKTIKEQLNLGTRYFDIRINTDDFEIYHGEFSLNLSFRNVMDDFIEFIQKYPSETILVQIKKELGSKSNQYMYQTIYDDYIAQYNFIKNLNITNLVNSSPQLKELRGKIFFIKRNGYENYGVNITFSDNTIFQNSYFYIQDVYDPESECISYAPFGGYCLDSSDRVGPKREEISNHISRRLADGYTNNIYVNFISMSWTEFSINGLSKFPKYFALDAGLNDYAVTESKRLVNNGTTRFYGMIFVYDFINTHFAKEIIDLNF